MTQKKHIQNLASSNDLLAFQHVINMLPGNVYWKNVNGEFLGCNIAQAKAVGCNSPEEVIGKTAFDTLPYDQAKEIFDFDIALMKDREPRQIEEWITLPNGEELRMLSYKSPLLTLDGTLIGMIGVSLDITDKYQLRYELKQKNQDLEKSIIERDEMLMRLKQFVMDQEHDIRTPISGIVGSAEALQLGRDSGLDITSEMMSEAIDDIVTSGKKLSDYQESLLFDLYADESKGHSIFKRFDLHAIVKDVYEVNVAAAKRKSLIYTYRLDDAVPRYLKANSKRLYQCLLDLIGNAIKFTDKGQVNISVSLIEQHDCIAIIQFTISDTGVGIPEDKQQYIYKEYFKVKSSNQGGDTGRGLGLARVYRYIDGVEGEIDFDSKLGEGSTFRVSLPIQVSLDQQQHS